MSSDERGPSGPSSPSSPASLILPSPEPNNFSFPRIQSSPVLQEDDYRLSWDPPQEKVSYPLPSFRSLFPADDEEHPLTSEYDPSEFSEPDPANDASTDEDDDPFFFSDTRTTFFRTSAERLRPRYPLLRIAARTTSPAPSPVPSLAQRNISEPAPSTKSTAADEVEESQPCLSPPALPQPSSSPDLSPVSLSSSPIPDPVSPLSALEPLSPLSSPLSLPPPSLAGDHDVAMDADLQSVPHNDEIPTPMQSDTGLGLFDLPFNPPVVPIASVPPLVAIAQPSASAIGLDSVSLVSSPSREENHLLTDMVVDSVVPQKKATKPPLAKSKSVENVGSREEKVVGDKSKKRSTQQLPLREEGPKPKKARVLAADSSPEASASRALPQSRTKRGTVETTKDVPTKGKKVTRTDARNPDRKGKRARSPPAPPPVSPSTKRSKQKVAPEIDPELCGMLIECMATSRASSMPMSTLYKTAMQSYPSIKSRGTEHECLQVMERVLESGTIAGGGTGVFGKVQGPIKDGSDPPLEAQWFYVPERDQDQDRAQLIRSMMPRPAKRGVTKEPKQYYYRPLEKISRWDREDEL